MVVRESVWERDIPFEADVEIPNTETRKALEDARTGIGLSGPFHSVSELMEALNLVPYPPRTGF